MKLLRHPVSLQGGGDRRRGPRGGLFGQQPE